MYLRHSLYYFVIDHCLSVLATSYKLDAEVNAEEVNTNTLPLARALDTVDWGPVVHLVLNRHSDSSQCDSMFLP